MRTAITTDTAPKVIGPYSQAIRAGQFLFVSGQVAIEPATGNLLTGSIENQTHQTMCNLGEILKAAGVTYNSVLRTTVFLVDMNDFSAMNTVYATYFGSPPPARTTIQVAKLPKDARVEIDAIALLENS